MVTARTAKSRRVLRMSLCLVARTAAGILSLILVSFAPIVGQ